MPINFTAVAAHTLIEKDGKYLVTKRSPDNGYMPNLWDTPGGTIHYGEAVDTALKREIYEETGLTCDQKEILFVYSFMSGPSRHQFQLLYRCLYQKGDIVLTSGDHDEYRWLTLEELKNLPDKIAFLEAFTKSPVAK
ncbi:MAG: NUDIX domain-containing protein [Candidatus Shapirobacteria bacterium]|jgi:8-oxo-dGTP diphosphatase